jgi:hypothetical protein
LSILVSLGFGETIGKIIDDKHKISGWIKILGLPIEIIERILARRPLVELYRLRSQVPTSSNLRIAVFRLFGEKLK